MCSFVDSFRSFGRLPFVKKRQMCWTRSAFLASGEEQIYSTSVYAFPQLASDSAQKEKRSSSGSAVTHVAVKKPTLLRIASEPAVASSSQLRMRLHSSVSPGERLFFGSGEEGAAGKAVSSSPPPSGPVLEDALGDMLALLSPGEYDLHFEASEPFLTTLGELATTVSPSKFHNRRRSRGSHPLGKRRLAILCWVPFSRCACRRGARVVGQRGILAVRWQNSRASEAAPAPASGL